MCGSIKKKRERKKKEKKKRKGGERWDANAQLSRPFRCLHAAVGQGAAAPTPSPSVSRRSPRPRSSPAGPTQAHSRPRSLRLLLPSLSGPTRSPRRTPADPQHGSRGLRGAAGRGGQSRALPTGRPSPRPTPRAFRPLSASRPLSLRSTPRASIPKPLIATRPGGEPRENPLRTQ